MPGLTLVERLVKFAGRRRTEERLKAWLARHTLVADLLRSSVAGRIVPRARSSKVETQGRRRDVVGQGRVVRSALPRAALREGRDGGGLRLAIRFRRLLVRGGLPPVGGRPRGDFSSAPGPPACTTTFRRRSASSRSPSRPSTSWRESTGSSRAPSPDTASGRTRRSWPPEASIAKRLSTSFSRPSGSSMKTVERAGPAPAGWDSSSAFRSPRLEAEIGGEEVSIGNENAPQQFVLTGQRDAVGKVIERLRPNALKAEMLPLAQCMHSPRLGDVTRRLKIFLEGKTPLRTPKLSLYAPMVGARISSLEDDFLGSLWSDLASVALVFYPSVDGSGRFFGLCGSRSGRRPHTASPVDAPERERVRRGGPGIRRGLCSRDDPVGDGGSWLRLPKAGGAWPS